MSVSSLSCEHHLMADSDDESVASLGAPPPPPHLELLELASDDGACIAHVVSYLDGDGRRAAARACAYLKDAVCESADAACETDDAIDDGVAMGQAEPLLVDDKLGPEPTVESPRQVEEFPETETKPDADDAMDEGEDSREDIRDSLAAEVEASKLKQQERDMEVAPLAPEEWMESEDAKRQLAEVEANLARGRAVATAAIKLAEEEVMAERRLSDVVEEADAKSDSPPPPLDTPPSLETVSLGEEKADADETVEGEESFVTEDLDSISTMDMKAQGDTFLARLSLDGMSTPLSFVSSQDYAEEKDPDDDLSTIPSLSDTPGSMPSPTTPLMSTPSPTLKSVSGAERLVIGGTSHLGDGRRLHIIGRARIAREMRLGPEGAYEDSQPPLPYDNGLPTLTRLRDLRNAASDDTPFDEEAPLVARSSSSMSSSPGIETARSSPGLISAVSSESDTADTETTADVLAQFSDAALFGGTPKVLNSFVNDIVGSAKSAVSQIKSDLYADKSKNGIDDSGPIKIGDKYYTHNEALQLWRKAKVKLADSYHQVDEEGNVLMEQAPFFEKNSVFEERSVTEAREMEEEYRLRKAGKKFRSKAEVRAQQGAVSLNELISSYSLVDQPSKLADASTLTSSMASGRHLRKRSNRVSFLSPVSEDIDSDASHDGSASFDDANETAETASLTKSDDGEAYGLSSDSEAGNGEEEKDSGKEPDAESVAGKDSLPSHMGSAYGVEVSSVRGMNCRFVNGKSSEYIAGGCDQSVLGSQYGTEVLFSQPKKNRFARKPRTKPRKLARHNMGIKSAKHSGAGANSSKQGTGSKHASQGPTTPKSSPPRKRFPLKLGMKKSAKA